MKSYIYIILSSLIMLTCSKITPEIQTKNFSGALNIIHKDETYSCGIISCNLKNELLNQKKNNMLKLPDLEYFQDRFGVIISRYEDFNTLIQSHEFKTYTQDINRDFFGCKNAQETCKAEEKKYSNNEMNYLFYIFIPEMIIQEYKKIGIDDIENIENVIQAVKQNDFTIKEIRLSLINYHTNKIKNHFLNEGIKNIDTTKLKSSQKYFDTILLGNGDGLLYSIIDESLKVNLKWLSEEEMEILLDETGKTIFLIIERLGIGENQWYESLKDESIKTQLKEKIQGFSHKYNLISKLPNDRLMRNDELFIFNSKNITSFEKNTFGNKIFYPELKEIRNLSYILGIIGKNRSIFYHPNMIHELKIEEGFIFMNLIEYLEHIDTNTLY